MSCSNSCTVRLRRAHSNAIIASGALLPPSVLVRVRITLLLTATLNTTSLSAQTVSGRVYDSLAKAPLAGATVQLISANSTEIAPAEMMSDGMGRFAFTSVAPGAYTLGFYHAVLDSIGIDPPFVRIQVVDQPVRADLAIPGPTRLLTAMCGARPPKKDSLGVLIGHLYDAETKRGVKNAQVVAEWYTLALVDGKLQESIPRMLVSTTSSGWFAVCNVPRDDDVVIEGIRENDTTGATRVHIPSSGIAERALFIDKTVVVPVSARDSAGAPDTTRPPQLVHRGTARVSGRISDRRNGQPIAGGLTQATDGRGAFTITGAPGGTQTLLIRAIGYLPERRTVDLLRDAPASLDVGLSNLRTMLDTMRVTANRLYARDASGFNRRRITGMGMYFDSADVARANVFGVSRMLMRVPGVELAGVGMSARVLMRRMSAYCQPTFIIDGAPFPNLLAGDLDLLVLPEEVVGIEVYARDVETPAQFRGMASFEQHGPGCGSVVVWTRRFR
jgi:carboxypeptidase family protein